MESFYEVDLKEFLAKAEEDETYEEYVSMLNRYNPFPHNDIFLCDHV